MEEEKAFLYARRSHFFSIVTLSVSITPFVRHP